MSESEIQRLTRRWMDAAGKELGDAAEQFATTGNHVPKSEAEHAAGLGAHAAAKERLNKAALAYACASQAYGQIIHMPVRKQRALNAEASR